MPIISPVLEFISTFIKGEVQDQLRQASCFDIPINGIRSYDVGNTQYGKYRFKDCSSYFKLDNARGRTQKIPRRSALVANTYIHGTNPTYQTVTNTYREISIDPTICVAVSFNEFDKNLFNVPSDDRTWILTEFSRALAERIHREAFALATTATQATNLAGAAIGGATTPISLSVIEDLKKRTFEDKHANKPRYLVITQAMAQDLARNGGFASNVYAPNNYLGDKGIKQYESGVLQGEILGCKVIVSDMLPYGSSTTSRICMMIVGEDVFGFANGETLTKNESERNFTEYMQTAIQYGLFTLDERCAYKFELRNI